MEQRRKEGRCERDKEVREKGKEISFWTGRSPKAKLDSWGFIDLIFAPSYLWEIRKP